LRYTVIGKPFVTIFVVSLYTFNNEMIRLKTLYILFCLAVFMFIAKPFIGFSININNKQLDIHNILIKSFSNRKPEDLQDAKQKAALLRAQLTNPPMPLLLRIATLLAFVFPFLFKAYNNTKSSYLNSLQLSLIPTDQPYLLAGKLII
jgi:hypothetical protein